MTPERFNKIVDERLSLCKKVLCKKATEYAKGDRLHNFKVAADLENCHPIKALGGMMAKHTVSVYDMIDDVDKGKSFSKEMWDEKIGDSLNYLLLLSALVEEELDVVDLTDDKEWCSSLRELICQKKKCSSEKSKEGENYTFLKVSSSDGETIKSEISKEK